MLLATCKMPEIHPNANPKLPQFIIEPLVLLLLFSVSWENYMALKLPCKYWVLTLVLTPMLGVSVDTFYEPATESGRTGPF